MDIFLRAFLTLLSILAGMWFLQWFDQFRKTATAASARPAQQARPRGVPTELVQKSQHDHGRAETVVRDFMPSAITIDYSTPMIEELKKRRRDIRNKACHCELEFNDLVQHWYWIQSCANSLDTERQDLSRKSKLSRCRRQRARSHDKLAAYTAQKAKLDQQTTDYNQNVMALNAERDWLEGTNVWKDALREMEELCVKTRSGEIYAREDLEEDEKEFGSFDDYLQNFKAEEDDGGSDRKAAAAAGIG